MVDGKVWGGRRWGLRIAWKAHALHTQCIHFRTHTHTQVYRMFSMRTCAPETIYVNLYYFKWSQFVFDVIAFSHSIPKRYNLNFPAFSFRVALSSFILFIFSSRSLFSSLSIFVPFTSLSFACESHISGKDFSMCGFHIMEREWRKRRKKMYKNGNRTWL